MNCLYCQQEVQSIASEVWQCLNCPHEVRFVINNIICIFIWHHGKEYCLSWFNSSKQFRISGCNLSIVSTIDIIVPVDNYMPEVITPNNAYQKFLTYMIFS